MIVRVVFIVAFALGAAAIIAMAASFLDSNLLALTITCVIGGVYAIGAAELLQFRRVTANLSAALNNLSHESAAAFNRLGDWLGHLHPSLQQAIRRRVEGDRMALPMPVLTPYLVSLLVMLGLLGTFVGLVVTLKGVVAALEGSADLEAIRVALTAPMDGLSLAFGTSVAGIAASAMLGLMSTLSRHERVVATRHLDDGIDTYLTRFSSAYRQQRTFEALQTQSQGLPEIAERLQHLVDHVGRMADTLSQQLVDGQERFHEWTGTAYRELASTVEKSLQNSVTQSERALKDSGRLVGEAVQPAIQEAMQAISAEVSEGMRLTQQALQQATTQHLDEVSSVMAKTSESLSSQFSNQLEQWISHAKQDQQAVLTALEEPITRLIAIASDTPKAAAEVITRLRDEVAENQARDNRMLEERTRLTQELDELTRSLADASGRQVALIEDLVSTSADALHGIADRFAGQVADEVSKASDVADHFAVGLAEINGLGEAFRVAVDQFNTSNAQLVASLQQIENALESSSARSDEQLGYYVNQAKGVIDYSVTAQRELFEELRRIGWARKAADTCTEAS